MITQEGQAFLTELNSLLVMPNSDEKSVKLKNWFERARSSFPDIGLDDLYTESSDNWKAYSRELFGGLASVRTRDEYLQLKDRALTLKSILDEIHLAPGELNHDLVNFRKGVDSAIAYLDQSPYGRTRTGIPKFSPLQRSLAVELMAAQHFDFVGASDSEVSVQVHALKGLKAYKAASGSTLKITHLALDSGALFAQILKFSQAIDRLLREAVRPGFEQSTWINRVNNLLKRGMLLRATIKVLGIHTEASPNVPGREELVNFEKSQRSTLQFLSKEAARTVRTLKVQASWRREGDPIRESVLASAGQFKALSSSLPKARPSPPRAPAASAPFFGASNAVGGATGPAPSAPPMPLSGTTPFRESASGEATGPAPSAPPLP